MKTPWIIGIVLALAVLGFLSFHSTPAQAPVMPPVPTPAPAASSSAVEYRNAVYGFVVALPKSWKGYTIVDETWAGDNDGKTLAQGPKISIRHPLWSTAKPRQDIPVLVFTLAQWDDMNADKFHIGAAPINPSELGRNTRYVFALPARYNFAYPDGFEEVDQIIQSKALSPLP